MIGVVAGGFIGYQVGNLLDHNDPDHYGALLGLPIGAVAGGAAGVWIASR